MKDDPLGKDGELRSGEDLLVTGDSHAGRDRLGNLVRALIMIVALAAAGVVLYWIWQVFVCDLRETVFKGMPRRAVWLCK